MKEALCDSFVDEHGLMEFRQGGGRGRQSEAWRFLSALKRYTQAQGKSCVSMADIYSVADEIELQVDNIRDFVDQLNDAGKLFFWGILILAVQVFSKAVLSLVVCPRVPTLSRPCYKDWHLSRAL